MSRTTVLLASVIVALSACGKPQSPRANANASAGAGAAGAEGGVFASLAPDRQQRFLACEVDAGELQRLLRLSYQQFDQDFSGGWRAVSDRDGCADVAQQVIEQYILFTRLTSASALQTLRFHAAQEAANRGEYAVAVAFMNATMPTGEQLSEDETLWKLYVQGSIAFLQRDRQQLQAVRDQLAAMPVSEEEKAARRKFLADNPRVSMPEGFVDEPQNLAVLDRFLRCYEAGYAEAYAGDC